MQAPSRTVAQGHRASSPPLSADSAFKEQLVGNTGSKRYLEQEAAHWGRLLSLMEGRCVPDSAVVGRKDVAKGHGLPGLAGSPGEALLQRLADLDEGGVDFLAAQGRSGKRSVKRAVCELLAALPGQDQEVLDELHSKLTEALEPTAAPNRNMRAALTAAIKQLKRLRKREMMPVACDWLRVGKGVAAPSEDLQRDSRILLTHAAGCAMEGRGQDLRAALKELVVLCVENRMPRESLGMLSIHLLAQCQVVSLFQSDELPRDVYQAVMDLLAQLREPFLSQVEDEIGSMLSEGGGIGHQEPSPDIPVTAPSFERMPWVLRSALNGVREGSCHWIAMLFASWAIASAIEAFLGAVDGHAWPPVTILGLAVGLAFIGVDRFFQKEIVNTQAFRPPADAQLGRYAQAKCFNLMRWTSLILPWVLPVSFFLFGLASFDAQARSSQGGSEGNGTSAYEPEPWQSSMLSPNASQCEIKAATQMSGELIDYAFRCALIPVQAQITGLVARPFRDLLQSGSRSRWTSGLSLCRCIINSQGKEEFIKLTDDEQRRVWLLRDVLYAVSSAGTLGVGQAFGKSLISLIQLRTCLAREAIGIEFKSVYGPVNEALDGFWPDLACKLVEWCPALVGLESPPDQPLVCAVDRQPCVVGDEDGLLQFRRHVVQNASARIATAATGNDAFGALATLCNRLGHPGVEAFFLIVGSLFNAATGGARARSANYLADPDGTAHPDTVTRLSTMFIAQGSSTDLTATPPTPRERRILEGLGKRHEIASTFKSGGGDSAGGDSMPTGTMNEEDSSRHGDHADESLL